MQEYPSELAVRRQQSRHNFIKAILLESKRETISSMNYKIRELLSRITLSFYIRCVSKMAFLNCETHQ